MPAFLKRHLVPICLGLSALLLWGCAAEQPAASTPTDTPQAALSEQAVSVIAAAGADVVSVQVSGDPGKYQFSVKVSSPDEGCQQYTDWWEVLGEDGTLLYRRILTHSHVDEQPFVRSGGPVNIQEGTLVIVRAHMHPGGYAGVAMRGSPRAGFEPVDIEAGFAANVESAPPQPQGCAF